MTGFVLNKYYLDCVSKEKELFIGYSGNIKSGFLNFNYSSIKVINAKKELKEIDSMDNGIILIEPNKFRWINNKLNTRCEWTGGKSGREYSLYNKSGKEIKWKCHKFNASSVARVAGKTIKGNGYVDQVTLNIGLKKLPFKELRWGRFISNNKKHYITWIETKGKMNKNIIISDSLETKGDISDYEISTDRYKLKLKEDRLINSKNVVDRLKEKSVLLRLILKRTGFYYEEEKYLCDAMLSIDDKTKTFGYAIKEKVKFN